MAMMERPAVTSLPDGGKCFTHEFEDFYLKAYVPKSEINGKVNNYTFRAPLLLVFEENRQSMEEAIAFAKGSGLEKIAADWDTEVLFIYPACEGGWANATEQLYASVIAQVKMNPYYEDGLCEITDFFTKTFQGYFVKGAIFRADIYSYGASADYVAKNLLTTIEGQYLWGPGEITPAVCSMERLGVVPCLDRTDMGIISVGNSDEVNDALSACEHLLIKDTADYINDFNSFVHNYKRWCGVLQTEPDFEQMNMTAKAGSVTVKTSADHRGIYKGTKEHPVGYFAYYNNDIFDEKPAPLVIGFHGGGDSSMYLTYVAGWYEIAHKYGFMFVSIENHQDVTATEAVQVIEDLKKNYKIDEHRIYATGFSMGSGKTWDMYQEYPQILAGIAPCSALFPVKNNPFSAPLGDRMNYTVPVPVFYSGGEDSHLPELPFQAETCLERVQYVAPVNKCNAKFEDLIFEEKDNWEDTIYGISGDRIEKVEDESRGSTLTIHYYNSEDGVCRTAFASVSGQVHECRQHSCENAWKFISQFTR